jgi:putative FmdB family regulatory protein
MPIYAYKCESCGHAKDVLQKMSDPLLTDCPACGAASFTKQLTAAGFQLKGSGWYATDFKNGGATSAPAVDKPSAGSAAASGAASGDSAASAKAESSTAAASASQPAASSATPTATGGCGTSCACH